MKETDHEFCKEFGKPNSFRFDRGFCDFCSFSCSTKWYAKNTNRIEMAMNTIKEKEKLDSTFNLRPNQKNYWINKGFSEAEAIQKVHERQQTFTKEKLIEKLGEEAGIQRWKDRQEKWQKNYTKRNFSLVSQELFWKLVERLPGVVCFFAQNDNGIKDESGKNHEYTIETDESFYKVDFFIPSINYCVEFDGDYWHGVRPGNQTRDAIRDSNILKYNPNIILVHVKERDFKANANYVVDTLLLDINERLKQVNATESKEV